MTNRPHRHHSQLITINCMIYIFSMLLLTQFYSLYFQGFFTQAGWLHHLNHINTYIEPHSLRKLIILFLIKTGQVSRILFACGLLLAACACALLLVRSLTFYIISFGFYIAWALLWSYPGMWTFEFLFPSVFAFLIGLASQSLSWRPSSPYRQLGYSTIVSVMIIFMASLLLYYLTSIAYIKHNLSHHIAICSAITFFVLSLFSLLTGNRITTNQKLDASSHHDKVGLLMDCIVLFIGAMLIMQVYANYFSGLFEFNNYKNLILYYSEASQASWLHPFLKWSADHAEYLLPLQMMGEPLLAVCLTLLLFRGPILLISFFLFIVLAFSELGVSATWPPTPQNLTWEWELFLVACISLIISIQVMASYQKGTSLKEITLGHAFYQNKTKSLSLLKITCIAISCGLGLYFIGIATKIFGESYFTISIFSGITYAILIFILLKFRS